MKDGKFEKGDVARWKPFGVTFVVDRVTGDAYLYAKGGAQCIWARDCELVPDAVVADPQPGGEVIFRRGGKIVGSAGVAKEERGLFPPV